MLTEIANGDTLPSFWPRVREFAVPASMIETATARRHAGDWAGACAAAGVDVDVAPRSVARTHGRELAARLRDDLRHLAPDLLRWHMPRIAPDGLLRPGLTVALARYDEAGRDGVRTVHLVARTPPAWADAGQRISLALWDGSWRAEASARRHPHPHPDRRFRLDLHRHLWDARRTGELRIRSGADRPPAADLPPLERDSTNTAPRAGTWAMGRWAAEAGILLRAEGRVSGTVAVRLGARHRLLLERAGDQDAGPSALRITTASASRDVSALPLLPDAAAWVLPDLELLRTGAIEAGRLHPLVASALAPDHPRAVPADGPAGPGQPHVVDCRGARHRIGQVDGVLVPLDHGADEIRREELLVALTGTPLPCLQVIDAAHRRPECLTGVRERLDHGDIAGALAVVEGLLGPGALLRDGPLRDELETAALRRITYGLFRADMTGPGPGSHRPDRRSARTRPSRRRRATAR
ncbi:hypothetical protein ACFYY2_11170 [Streptomyces sp. NPDC001822]|uniref:hypothetical protein n=1 Tax=Streptomyces sp. NPDC001822 TaxID=3364614 RepID=UPI0036AA6810